MQYKATQVFYICRVCNQYSLIICLKSLRFIQQCQVATTKWEPDFKILFKQTTSYICTAELVLWTHLLVDKMGSGLKREPVQQST